MGMKSITHSKSKPERCKAFFSCSCIFRQFQMKTKKKMMKKPSQEADIATESKYAMHLLDNKNQTSTATKPKRRGQELKTK